MKIFVSIFPALAIISVLLALLYGWVMNIVALFGLSLATVNIGELILRVAGVFVAPLGSIMGLFF